MAQQILQMAKMWVIEKSKVNFIRFSAIIRVQQWRTGHWVDSQCWHSMDLCHSGSIVEFFSRLCDHQEQVKIKLNKHLLRYFKFLQICLGICGVLAIC
jgi:hypothetical protein